MEKRLYRIYDHYLDYLRVKNPEAARRIPNNKTTRDFARPYFPLFDLSEIDPEKAGLLIMDGELSNIMYYAPIGHLSIEAIETNYRIGLPAERPGLKSFLDLTKMIPVKKNSGTVTWLLDKIEKHSGATLLEKDFYNAAIELELFLNNNSEEIIQRAKGLRTSYSDAHPKFQHICCDFPRLELLAAEYQKIINRSTYYAHHDEENGNSYRGVARRDDCAPEGRRTKDSVKKYGIKNVAAREGVYW